MELVSVYRVRSSGKLIESKVKSAYLYLNFYLPVALLFPSRLSCEVSSALCVFASS